MAKENSTGPNSSSERVHKVSKNCSNEQKLYAKLTWKQEKTLWKILDIAVPAIYLDHEAL